MGNKIPKSVIPLFQEYDYKLLDIRADKNIIMQRILEFGTKGELQWLFDIYATKEVANFVKLNGYRALSCRAFNFWRLVLGVQSYNKPKWLKDKRKIWKF